MKDASWYAVRNVTDKNAEVSIYDEIGLFGITAKEFTNSLKSLGNRRLTVRIHSPGGEIFEGNAVYNALRRHKGGVDVAIDGLAASMASVIAMAGDKRSMAENAMFMIHNPWTVTYGESSDLRKSADLMDTLKEGIINAYAGRTGIDREQLGSMMDEETWLTAEEAKEYGFITDITEGLNMQNSFQGFDISRFPKRPTNFMAKKSDPTPEPVVTIVSEPFAEVVTATGAEAVTVSVPEIDIEAQVSSLEAKYKSVIEAKDAEITGLKAKLGKVSESLSRLEASYGIAPASVVIEVPAGEKQSLIDTYNSLDGEEATAFYRKHQADLSKFIVQKA